MHNLAKKMALFKDFSALCSPFLLLPLLLFFFHSGSLMDDDGWCKACGYFLENRNSMCWKFQQELERARRTEQAVSFQKHRSFVYLVCHKGPSKGNG